MVQIHEFIQFYCCSRKEQVHESISLVFLHLQVAAGIQAHSHLALGTLLRNCCLLPLGSAQRQKPHLSCLPVSTLKGDVGDKLLKCWDLVNQYWLFAMRNKFVHQPPHFTECPRSSWNVEFVLHWVKLWQCEEGIAELPNTVVSSLPFCLDEFSHPCTEFQGDLIAGLMPPCALAGIPARLGQHKVQDDLGLCRL